MSCDDEEVVKRVNALYDEPVDALFKLKQCLSECNGDCQLDVKVNDDLGLSLLSKLGEWCQRNPQYVNPKLIVSCAKNVESSSAKLASQRLSLLIHTLLNNIKFPKMKTAILVLKDEDFLSEFAVDRHKFVRSFLSTKVAPPLPDKRLVLVTGFINSGKSTHILKNFKRWPRVDGQRSYATACYDSMEHHQDNISQQFNHWFNGEQQDELKIMFKHQPSKLKASVKRVRQWAQSNKKRGSFLELFHGNPVMKAWCRSIFAQRRLAKTVSQMLAKTIKHLFARHQRLVVEVESVSPSTVDTWGITAIEHRHIVRRSDWNQKEVLHLCTTKDRLNRRLSMYTVDLTASKSVLTTRLILTH